MAFLRAAVSFVNGSIVTSAAPAPRLILQPPIAIPSATIVGRRKPPPPRLTLAQSPLAATKPRSRWPSM
jgi:hypothetical protein